MSVPIRRAPSGDRIPVALRALRRRQNPNAVQTIVAGDTDVVLFETVELDRNEAVLVEIFASGFSAGAGGSLTAEVFATFPPGAPALVESGRAQAGVATSARVALSAFVVPADTTIAQLVRIDLTMTAVAQDFDVGTRPDGGCSLLVWTVDLGSAANAVASP